MAERLEEADYTLAFAADICDECADKVVEAVLKIIREND
jgi:hypothetical protein